MMMMMRRRTAVVQGGQEIGKEQKQEEEEGKDVTKTRRVKGYHHHHLLAAWDEKWVWRLCLAFRLLNAMLVQTYFNPDEHWQALEVAHRIAFGYGHLTWEWQQGLRSYLHPLLFAALYKLLTTLHLDTPWFMTKAPRLLQSVFAAVGDVYLYKFSRNNFGERVAQWTMFCQMFNWFTFFCIVRTFSNCLETVLTTMALFYWWPVQSPSTDHHHTGSIFTSRQLGLLLAGVACIIRPTSAIIWVYVGVVQLLKIQHKLQFLLSEVFPIGIICLCAMGLVDSWMYGKWTPVLLNFFSFNFLTSGASFYGRHSWHWYFSQGLPAMAFTFLPFALIGILWSKQWALAGLIAWVLALYSILGHKEFRFILPVLPIVMMYAGYAMAVLEQQGSSANSKEETAYSVPSSTSSGMQHQGYEQKKPTGGTRQGSCLLGGIIIFLLLTNIPLALYTSMFHQRGAEAVMEHLGQEAHAQHVRNVLFLMPCHATPFYSSLHSNLPMRFLDCSPSEEPGHVSEDERFMANPLGFLSTMFQGVNKSDLPSHIVLFSSLELEVHPFLNTHQYSLDKSFFHAHFAVDRELQAYVMVFTQAPIHSSIHDHLHTDTNSPVSLLPSQDHLCSVENH